MMRRILCFLCFVLCAGMIEAKPAAKQVLLLNSYHRGYLFSDETVRGVEETFADQNIKLHIEYLDSKRHNLPDYIDQIVEILKQKNRETKYDLVICSDNNAFNLLKKYRDAIYGTEIPVIFCGINFLHPDDLDGFSNCTGLSETADIPANCNLIRELYPDRTKLLFLTDTTITGHAIQQEVERLMPELRQNFSKVTLSADRSMSEIQHELRQLDDTWVVLYSFLFRDSSGAIFEYDESARMIAEAAPVPVHCLWRFSMGSGMVGGNVVDGHLQGVSAAKMALEVLNGRPANEIPVLYQTPLSFVFDYNALKRFGISEKRLPENHTLINKPPSLYATHRLFFLGAIICITAMTFIILSLAYGLRRSRKAEEALKENRQFLLDTRKFLESILNGASEIAIIATDHQGRIILFNKGANLLLGYTSEEAMGASIIDLLHDTAEIAASQKHNAGSRFEAFLTRTEQQHEWTYIRKDGSRCTVSLIVSALKNEQDAPTGGYLHISLDITARKESEKKLQKARIYISSILDSTPSWIIGVDNNGRINQLNQTVHENSGISLSQARGKMVFDLFPQLDDCRELITQALESGQTGNIPKTSMSLNPRMKYAAITVFPLSTEGVAIRVDDITEQEELEQKLVQKDKMQLIGQLAGGVAHDFNNLLGGMFGLLETLQDHVDSEGKHYLELALSNAKHAADLTTQLLVYSRKGPTTREPIDINKPISGAIALLMRSLNKNIIITTALNVEDGFIMGDYTQLHSALLNLGINAGHAMPNGGSLSFETRQIHLDEDQCRSSLFKIQPGDYLEIEVRDSGIGIPPEDQPYVFEPFFTTREGNEGTGLGLASVYGTIEEHHGEIALESEVGQGTRFIIHLPLIKEKPPEETTPEAIVCGEGTILLVDDDPLIQTTTKLILKKLGYNTIIASSGEEAIKLYKERQSEIALILLDMIMSGMSGSETLKHLKKLNPTARVLIASGYHETQAEELEGHSGFIKKPYTTQELSRSLARCLARPS